MEKQEEVHNISIFVESRLYPQIRVLIENGASDEEIKQAIEKFVEMCTQISTKLTEEEIDDLVCSVLERTLDNERKINNRDDDENR